jgi:hypothetical protein
MEWIVGALALVVVLLVTLYRKSIRECNHLTNFALLILLDERVYAAQRKGLADLVHTIEAKNAGDLGGRVNLALIQLAERLGDTMLGTAGLLWKLKNTPVQNN